LKIYDNFARCIKTMNTIDYKIPKIQIKVDIMVHHNVMGKESQEGEYLLFLNEFSRYRKGPETVYEFLNKKKKFIPLKACGSGEFMALNIDALIYVREKEIFDASTSQSLTLFLENNVLLEVEHFNQLPDSQSRVLDYLNQESQFILFRHHEQKIFVNKHKIIRVNEK